MADLIREPAPRRDEALTRLASKMTRPVPASSIMRPCKTQRGWRNIHLIIPPSHLNACTSHDDGSAFAGGTTLASCHHLRQPVGLQSA